VTEVLGGVGGGNRIGGAPEGRYFRFRTLVSDNLGAVAVGVDETIQDGGADFVTGDSLIKYVTVQHSSGGSRTFRIKATIDGTLIQTQVSATDGSVVYIFLDSHQDELESSTTRTPFDGDEFLPVQTFGPLIFAGVTNPASGVTVTVKYGSLF